MSIPNSNAELRNMQINFDKILNYIWNGKTVNNYLDIFYADITELNQQNLVNAIFNALNMFDLSTGYQIKVTISNGNVVINTFKSKCYNTFNNFINGNLGEYYNSQPEVIQSILSPYKQGFSTKFIHEYCMPQYANCLSFRRGDSMNNILGCIILYSSLSPLIIIL